MRKTFPLHVLANLESTRPAADKDAPRSRRKRAVKATVPAPSPIASAFDRLTASLQPELDAFDLAWTA
jgi:hypothetical protein